MTRTELEMPGRLASKRCWSGELPAAAGVEGKFGHYGTGDLEMTIRARDDLEKAKTLFTRSYEAS